MKWAEQSYKHFVQDDQIQASHELNSLQQGFLYLTTEHPSDDYSISVNPDVCTKLFFGSIP